MKTTDEVLSQINEIFKDILENDDLIIQYKTTADDIEEWDSLSHIQLIVAIEKHFKIRFTSVEINSFKNVGEMSDAIVQKIAV